MLPLIPLYDCDLVAAGTQERLRTVTLPLVPRVGEEIGLGSDVLRVASVRYELDTRQRVRLGHLARITVGLEPAV